MLGVVFSIVVPNGAAAHQAQGTSGTVLRSIRVAPTAGGGATTVVLEADGPLPEPTSEALDGPPRVYLDLKDVTPAATLARWGSDALIVRTRVARHSENPVVTRVVLDLSRASPYRIDAAAAQKGVWWSFSGRPDRCRPRRLPEARSPDLQPLLGARQAARKLTPRKSPRQWNDSRRCGRCSCRSIGERVSQRI